MIFQNDLVNAYDHWCATAVDVRFIVGTHNSEIGFVNGSCIKRHCSKIANDEDLEYPRKNGEEQSAQDISNSALTHKKEYK